MVDLVIGPNRKAKRSKARCGFVLQNAWLYAKRAKAIRVMAKENKTQIINFRLSEADYQKLLLNMDVEGYSSKTKYIRSRILGRRGISAHVVAADGSSASQRIQELIIQVKKIGGNINQTTRNFNYLIKLQQDGKRAISNRTLLQLGQTLNDDFDKLTNAVSALCNNLHIEEGNDGR